MRQVGIGKILVILFPNGLHSQEEFFLRSRRLRRTWNIDAHTNHTGDQMRWWSVRLHKISLLTNSINSSQLEVMSQQQQNNANG